MLFTRPAARAALLFLAIAGCLLLARPAAAADAVVGDGTPGSCTETRFDQALATVQASLDGELSFNCGGPATIVFTSQKVIDTQLLVIKGGNQITLSGANSTRLFHVLSGNLELRTITLTNGYSGNGYGGAILAENGTSVYVYQSTIRNSRTNDNFGGGAILSFATGPIEAITIEESIIRDNTSTYAAINAIGRLIIRNSQVNNNIGGGLSVAGATEIVDTLFEANESTIGAAIRNAVGTVEMTGGALRNNRATNRGGAIYNTGNVVLTQVSASENQAGEGGVIFNTGYVFLDSVTLSANQVTSAGGAAYNQGTLVAFNATFSANSAPFASEVRNDGSLVFELSTIAGDYESASTIINLENPATTLRFKSTIVLGSGRSGATCLGKPATSSDFSLYRNTSCSWSAGSGNIVTTSPFIVDHLADNGGPTLTHMPFGSGPAIDAGQCELDVDQRGVARPQGPACDIGSVERRLDEGAPKLLFMPLLRK